MQLRKSWADRQGIQTGVAGEILLSGITISEKNRATTFEYRRAGIEVLLDICRKNYRDRGVEAVVFGVWEGPEKIKYAVYVEDGFLREVEDDE